MDCGFLSGLTPTARRTALVGMHRGCRAARGHCLGDVIVFARLTVVIRPAMDDGDRLEVAVSRRRGGGPFERIAVPRIAARPWTKEQTVEEVDQEDQLASPQDKSADADELVERL